MESKELPEVDAFGEETGMYGLDTAQFLNLHDWVTHAVTGFFFLATLASIVGVFSRTQERTITTWDTAGGATRSVTG